jgi:dihydrofolate reductase
MNNGTGFKLLLAVSADGFLARGPLDDMAWTGRDDKAVFRLLTTTHKGPLLAGRRTAELLPRLDGREVQVISRDRNAGYTLQEASWMHRDAWLIGGPTVAREALEANLVELAVICQAPAVLGDGIPFKPLKDLLPDVCTYRQLIGGIYVDIYTRVH